MMKNYVHILHNKVRYLSASLYESEAEKLRFFIFYISPVLRKVKSDIIFWITILILLIIGYQLKEVVLPFVVAFLMSMAFSPIADWFQRFLKKRVLAVSGALLSILVILLSVLLVFTSEIIRDVNRLGDTFTQFAEVNSAEIDESATWVKEQFDKYVQPVLKENEKKLDSLYNQDISQILEKDSLMDQLNSDQLEVVYDALFGGGEIEQVEEEGASLSWLVVFFSSIGYFLYMIFSWGYFKSRISLITQSDKIGPIAETLNEVKEVLKEFLKQRGSIVLIYTIYFILSFYLLGLPGALILGVISGLLCFIPYLQYFMLIPIALFCVILNMEGELGYFVYLGIAIGIFVIGTIVEELVLIPKIFKQENSLNPAVLMFSLAVFGETMGLFGVMLAVPFTILAKSYLKRLLL